MKCLKLSLHTLITSAAVVGNSGPLVGLQKHEIMGEYHDTSHVVYMKYSCICSGKYC